MPRFNFLHNEIEVTIVFCGPSSSGKKTVLKKIHEKTPENNRSDINVVIIDNHPFLFFESFSVDIGTLFGMSIRAKLLATLGTNNCAEHFKIILQEADGIICIMDSDAKKINDNKSYLKKLEQSFLQENLDIKYFPIVIQWNKLDLPDALDEHLLERYINYLNITTRPSIAISGEGVFPTLIKCWLLITTFLNQKYQNLFSQEHSVAKTTTRRKNLNKISNYGKYYDCIFHLNNNESTKIDHCFFENCSFRGEKTSFILVRESFFINCNFDTLEIEHSIKTKFSHGYIHILNLGYTKNTFFSQMNVRKCNVRYIDDQGFKNICETKNITEINLSLTEISHNELELLSHSESIKKISLPLNSKFSKLQSLQKMPLLESLSLLLQQGTKIYQNVNFLRITHLNFSQKERIKNPMKKIEQHIFADNLGKNTKIVYQQSKKILNQLKYFSNLEKLELANICLTKKEIFYFCNLTKLKYLNLAQTNIDNQDLKSLENLLQLEYLFLCSNEKINDLGMPNLHHLKNLKMIHLAGTKVTEQGKEFLEKHFPQTLIVK